MKKELLRSFVYSVSAQKFCGNFPGSTAFHLSKNLFKLEKLLPFSHLFHRLDSLVGLFGAGCQPSSTNDPFGLRRVSYGLVRELEKAQLPSHETFPIIIT